MTTEKILDSLDLPKLVKENALSVPLDFKNEYGNNLAIFASVYVFAPQGLHRFVKEIIEHTHNKTIDQIKEVIKEKNT